MSGTVPARLKKTLAFFDHAGVLTCFPAGGGAGRHKVRVIHVFDPPAGPSRVRRVEKALGKTLTPAHKALLNRGDGCLLFLQQDHPDGFNGILLVGSSKLARFNREARRDVSRTIRQDPGEFVPNLLFIGTVLASGNYLAMDYRVSRKDGEHPILHLDHETNYRDCGKETVVARSLADFLKSAAANPARLLNDTLGCFVRYSDLRTDIQWIPQRYHRSASTTGAGL